MKAICKRVFLIHPHEICPQVSFPSIIGLVIRLLIVHLSPMLKLDKHGPVGFELVQLEFALPQNSVAPWGRTSRMNWQELEEADLGGDWDLFNAIFHVFSHQSPFISCQWPMAKEHFNLSPAKLSQPKVQRAQKVSLSICSWICGGILEPFFRWPDPMQVTRTQRVKPCGLGFC